MHNFKGKVIIEDIKEELENLVNTINNIIDTIQETPTVDSIDYTVGAPTVAPTGSTLSVGGLKHLLSAYDGAIIGCKVCEGLAINSLKLTDGILFTKDGVVRLPSHSFIQTDATSIYYNKKTGTYQTESSPEEEEDLVKVCDLNTNRPGRFVSDNRQIEVEDFPGKYEIGVQSRVFGNNSLETSFYPPDRNVPYFFAGIEAPTKKGTLLDNAVNLFSQNISSNGAPTGREVNYWTPASLLFIPKGISPNNLFTIRGQDASKTFNVIINKKIEY